MCNQKNSNINQTGITYRIYSTCDKREDALLQLESLKNGNYKYFAIRNNSNNRTCVTLDNPSKIVETKANYDEDIVFKYYYDLDTDDIFNYLLIIDLP
ncbi:Uncharacterised protein [Morganella morganii]|nr:Uncharacterised protein [Morganella morganii]